MVLEVPNKSSNILNTFGLSKSHRSGIAEPAAAPACRVLFAALALAISHARAHARGARIEAAAASAIYYCWLQPYSRVEGSKEGWWLQRLESKEGLAPSLRQSCSFVL